MFRYLIEWWKTRKLIKAVFADYPLNKCKCGATPGFWFRRDNSWTVRCTNDLCVNRWNDVHYKPKARCADKWNKNNP